jgi:biopolymer transport protein ExbD
MNYLLEVCFIALALATGITPSVVSGSGLKLIRETEAPGRAAQAMQKGISVKLATTRNAAPMPDADNADSLIVTVTHGGGVYFGIDPISPAALAEKVHGRLSNREQRLYIKADARASYANVMKVLEALRTAGIEAATLLTAQPESSQPGTLVPPKGLEALIAPPSPSGSQSTVVQVLSSGQQWPMLKINNDQIPREALQSTLRQFFQNRSEKVVLVKADGRLSFADVVNVIDTCRSTGATVVLAAPGQ